MQCWARGDQANLSSSALAIVCSSTAVNRVTQRQFVNRHCDKADVAGGRERAPRADSYI
jgi:hypothetical protein